MVRRQIVRMLRGGGKYNCGKVHASEGGNAEGCKDEEYLCHQLLEYEKGQTITIFGYKRNLYKTMCSYIGVILTLGVLRLLFYWFPRFWIICTHDSTALKASTQLLIEDDYRGKWKTYASVLVEVLSLENNQNLVYYLENNILRENNTALTFTYKSIKFVLDSNKFVPLHGLSDGLIYQNLHAYPGLTEEERQSRINIYGPNEIKVPMTPIFQLVLLEILTPFYVFQLGSLTLWIVEGYFYMVIVIVILTVLGIGGHVLQTRQNERNLRKKVKAKDTISIIQPSSSTAIASCTINLVPGDVIQPKEGYIYSDSILLRGTCLVDESMLTGEFIQILKTPIPNNSNLYNLEDSAPHTLFAGTRIVQVNQELKALVTTTGFLTSKGSLIRSIMYPPPMDYAFDKTCTTYCFLMFLIGTAFAIHIAITKSKRGIPTWDLVIKTLDSITILLPAALPATLAIGKLYALKNLKKKKIFCTNSKVLTSCGSIDVVCLDKTGTITEESLDFIGVISRGDHEIKNNCYEDTLERGMATCHNLTIYNDQLQGDQLEVQMFKAVNANFLENHTILLKTHQNIRILERYQFSSNLRRMSVITTNSNNQYEIFCKGSPEIIKSLCNNPEDILEDDLLKLTKQSYRVISIASRKISSTSIDNLKTLSREDIEKDLTFLGYLVFENKLKSGSKEVIQELQDGGVAIKMITGDNIDTAVSVAKECGIFSNQKSVKIIHSLTNIGHSDGLKTTLKTVDQIAITGVAWTQILGLLAKDPDLLKIAIPKIQVFARMASVQKQQVVEQLQSLGLVVCMCGDGANDCSALKASNVGISLTESESSMAAHLTSRIQNISAVLDITKEGRSALVTIITIAKMVLTGNMIQYIGILLLYEIDSSYSDFQFLWLDLHMLLYGFFIGYVNAYDGPLSSIPPTKSLLSWKPNISMLGQLIPTALFQLLLLGLTRSQTWFVPYQHDNLVGNDFRSFENFVVFILGSFQYTTACVVYSKGKPYRQPIWTNVTLVVCILGWLCCDLLLGLGKVKWLMDLFELMVPPDSGFQWIVIGIAVGHMSTAFLIENVIVEGILGRFIFDRTHINEMKHNDIV